jgi:hypothetical protein
MNVFLVIDKEVFPITVENETEIFNLKEDILGKFNQYIENRKKYIEACNRETERFNNVLHRHRNHSIVDPNELNLEYPPKPNNGNYFVDIQGLRISSELFTDFRNGNPKKMNIAIYKESEFWEGYKKHLKTNWEKHLEKK